MLDEIREYDEYTLPMEHFIDENRRRLKYASFVKDGLSGMERAMTIIARRHLFGDGESLPAHSADECREVLKAWCGFGFEKAIPAAAALAGWAPRYLRHIFLKEALDRVHETAEELPETGGKFLTALTSISPDDPLESLRGKEAAIDSLIHEARGQNVNITYLTRIKYCIKALTELRGKASYYAKSLFDVENAAPKRDNDYKSISYDKIIADAYELGPLRQRYLVYEGAHPLSSQIRKRTKRRLDGKNLLENEQDVVLKLTAAYLLQQYGSNRYAVVNKVEIANWLTAKDYKMEHLEDFLLAPSLEPLFETPKSIGGNVKKIGLHPDWIKRFQIADAHEFDPTENQGLIFMSDLGTGTHLQDGTNRTYDF